MNQWLGLWLVAACAAVASFGVLAIAGTGTGTWIVQGAAVATAGVLTLVGKALGRTRWNFPTAWVLALSMAGIAVPLLAHAPGPQRWLSLGPLSLYAAPVFLPVFLIGCSVWVDQPGRPRRAALVGIVGAMALLAAQPDASQALALLVGSAVVLIRGTGVSRVGVIAWLVAALLASWAWTRPDPLQPLAHVEGVFALSLGVSPVLGFAVICSALAVLVALHRQGNGRLSPVAAYFGVLYGCSVAGLTPAPLIGYGTGPWLGFGLVVAAFHWLEPRRR